MRIRYWVGLFLACVIMANAAPVPYSFNYQGVLRGGAGERLGDVQKVTEFRLYDSATGGTPLWGRTYTVQLDTNGLFNVGLGDSGAPLSNPPLVTTPESLSAVIASRSELFLGLTVTGASEIAPRQQLLSVPFAMMAGDVQSASGNFTVEGTLTANKKLIVPAPAVIEGYGTVPIGTIVMWSGAAGAYPENWALCDGENNTPDLRDRFVVGAGKRYPVQATGGAAEVTLTTSQIPAHHHYFKDGYYVEQESSKTHYGVHPVAGGILTLPEQVTGSHGTDSDNDQLYYRDEWTANTGGGAAHENRPPYFALYYIIRVK